MRKSCEQLSIPTLVRSVLKTHTQKTSFLEKKISGNQMGYLCRLTVSSFHWALSYHLSWFPWSVLFRILPGDCLRFSYPCFMALPHFLLLPLLLLSTESRPSSFIGRIGDLRRECPQMQIKPTVRQHFAPTRMAIMKKIIIRRGYGEIGTLLNCWWK